MNLGEFIDTCKDAIAQQRRGRKPRPASMSMFEWALEREKEPADRES